MQIFVQVQLGSMHMWCIYIGVYTLSIQSDAVFRPVLQMATENHGNPTPPHIPMVFPPPLTEFVAENRLLTSSGWVGGTKVPGEGRRSVLSVLSVAKTETRPESSRPSSQRHASRLNRLLSCHPAPHRIGYRRLGADAALAGPSPAQHFHPSTRISHTAGGAVTPCRGT